MKIKKQIIFNDETTQKKECARCHKIFSYCDFYKVNSATNKVRPYCKKCNSELNLVRQYKKKIKVLKNTLGLNCSICNKSISYLPSFSLHHPNPEIKTISWRELKKKSYNFIINFFEKEDVELRCSNCHLKEHAIAINKYGSLINRKNLFSMNPNEIRNEIFNMTEDIFDKLERAHAREKIREWIKKRYIIKYLFNNKCIVCGTNDLPVLEFHHRNPKIENKLKWSTIESLTITQIVDIVLSQECVCLCSNCHSNAHSRFNEFAEEILRDFFIDEELDTYLRDIIIIYQNLREKIKIFIVNSEIHLKSPLKIEIPQKMNWKIHLLKLYYFLDSNNKEFFRAYELEKELNISIKHIYKHLNNFIKADYIENISKIRGLYRFTQSGLNMINSIEKTHSEISRSLKNDIYNKK